jgi:hypothetical protein
LRPSWDEFRRWDDFRRGSVHSDERHSTVEKKSEVSLISKLRPDVLRLLRTKEGD